ncbi:hypothetical protein FRC19_003687 [Serendipita sp. 401]|nr:hypothetical protein FRC15_008483 [Serendipita sp. 397]KAG8799434.1 hypothetical protein FRC18_008283 [Serendipita sp. 400]KAG8811634.1 hypothetical protein FRC19_003687 [Serendipita sp. 401]KAG9040736.1 hypothetical protein FS842_002857 [Serendipita sp. 407]
MAGIQAQVMSISINTSLEDQSTKVCIINALFVGGLVLDLVASFLAFLTARWLQRLSKTERAELEQVFEAKNSKGLKGALEKGTSTANQTQPPTPPPTPTPGERIILFWCSLSLFIPMPLLVLGVICMTLGIEIYVWTFHKTIVGILVSFAYVALVPFVVGVFTIGSGEERRKGVIHELGKRQGDW